MIGHLPVVTSNVPTSMQNGNIGPCSPTGNACDNQPHLSSSKRGFLGKGM